MSNTKKSLDMKRIDLSSLTKANQNLTNSYSQKSGFIVGSINQMKLSNTKYNMNSATERSTIRLTNRNSLDANDSSFEVLAPKSLIPLKRKPLSRQHSQLDGQFYLNVANIYNEDVNNKERKDSELFGFTPEKTPIKLKERILHISSINHETNDKIQIERNEEILKRNIEKKLMKISEKLEKFETFFKFSDEEIRGNIRLCTSNMIIQNGKLNHKLNFFPEFDISLVEGMTEIELRFFNIMKLTYNKINMQAKEIEALKEKFKECELEKLQINKKITDKITMISSNSSSVYEREIRELRYRLKTTLEDMEKRDNMFNTKKQKFRSLIELLSKKVEENGGEKIILSLTNQLTDLKTDKANEITKLTQLIEQKDIKIARFEVSKDNYKMIIKDLDNEIANIKQENEKNKVNIASLTNNIESLQIYANQKTETALMEAEEIYSLNNKIKLQLEYVSIAQSRLLEKDSKLEEMNRVFGAAVRATNEFYKDEELFQNLKGYFFYSNKFKIQNEVILDSVTHNDSNNIDLARYNLCRPNFYSLVAQDYLKFTEVLKMETNQIGKKSLDDYEFISLIRGILDSKFNEFLYTNDPKLYSKFPEFVYSWLGKFDFDPITRKIRRLTTNELLNSDLNRGKFFYNLNNALISKLWDIITFKEFLDEKSSLDEVYFYLFCRNGLYGGSELINQSSTFNIIHFVLFEKVQKLVLEIMIGYDPNYIKKIINKLKAKMKRKFYNIYIDGSFVLSVLLEFYRQERRNKLFRLREIFDKVMYNNPITINFQIFKDIIETDFFHISDLEKAQLYRDAWNLGSESITYETLFVAATESNFFIKSIKLNGLYPKPTLSGNGDVLNVNPEGRICNEILKHYSQYSESIENIQDIIGNFGSERLCNELLSYQIVFDKKFQVPKSDLKGLNYTQFYFEYLTFLMRISHLFGYSGENMGKEFEKLMRKLPDFKNFFSNLENETLIKKAIEMEINKKTRKLQHFFMNRKSKWLDLISLIFETPLRKKRSKSESENTAKIPQKMQYRTAKTKEL